MAERKLPARRRRASKGREIRISDLVYKTLNEHRGEQSWDALMRKVLGLPNRRGICKILLEGILEPMTGKFFLRPPDVPWSEVEMDAREVGIGEAVKRKTRKVAAPLRMRELP